LQEAEILLEQKMYDGAFYLAGYAVELYFKAKICELLRVDDFYSKHVPNTALSKTYLVHNFDTLLLLSGLYTVYQEEMTHNQGLMQAWACIQEQNWSEKVRYAKPNSCDNCTAIEFINAIKIFTQWIATQH
jgi:hypothetical protein